MKMFCLAPWMPTKNSIVKKIDTFPSWYQRRQADPSNTNWTHDAFPLTCSSNLFLWLHQKIGLLKSPFSFA